MTQRKREKVRSPEEILSIVMLSVIPQEDSYKNIMFTHFPSLSGARSALASLIGSEAVRALIPFTMCLCECVFLTIDTFAKKATYSVFRSPFVCQRDLKII